MVDVRGHVFLALPFEVPEMLEKKLCLKTSLRKFDHTTKVEFLIKSDFT